MDLGCWRWTRGAHSDSLLLKGLENCIITREIHSFLQHTPMKTPTVRETTKVCRKELQTVHYSVNIIQIQWSCYLVFIPKRFKIHEFIVRNPKGDFFFFFCQCNNYTKWDITGLLALLIAIQREWKKEKGIYYWAQMSTQSSNCLPRAPGRTPASL